MIPPSVLFLLYGLMTEQSIGKLFMAGILPGIVGTLLYMAAVWWTTGRHPEYAPRAPKTSWAERRASIARIWQVLILFVVVLGGMYWGFFSPTEGAAVGAFGAIVISWIGGHLNRASFAAAMKDTALTTGMIFVILIGAGVFNYFIDQTGLTDALIGWVEHFGLNRWVVMLMLMVMYIILGALMDELSMILLTVGPVFKLVTALGFDPIWFGVMLVTVCEIGMIVPPVGINLFVIQGVGKLSMNTVVRGIAPFVAADCVRMVIIAVFPWLALWLPSLM